jgi:hypothetical protein
MHDLLVALAFLGILLLPCLVAFRTELDVANEMR